jgi:hypothetical protein
MTIEQIADKLELTELSNKLFMYCDAKQWDKMLAEVFTPVIWFDASSIGAGEPRSIPAKDVCAMWDEGLAGLDAIHHQSGHYLITVQDDKAAIYAYGKATHYKKAATKGNTRSFVGSYDLKAERVSSGWRLSQFKFNLKYMEGNSSLE